MQHLWQAKIHWDEQSPSDLKQQWLNIQDQLPLINDPELDRMVVSKEKAEKLTLQLFSDASEAAYGACIYVQSIDSRGNVTVRMLCSRSRVASLKRISLPRLGLCASMLLADMYQTTVQALKTTFCKVRFRTNSTVVLSWHGSPPASWKTFVPDQVSHI